MAAIGDFAALLGRTLGGFTELSGGTFALLQRETALLVYALLIGVPVAILLYRRMRRTGNGEDRIVLPAILGPVFFPKSYSAPFFIVLELFIRDNVDYLINGVFLLIGNL